MNSQVFLTASLGCISAWELFGEPELSSLFVFLLTFRFKIASVCPAAPRMDGLDVQSGPWASPCNCYSLTIKGEIIIIKKNHYLANTPAVAVPYIKPSPDVTAHKPCPSLTRQQFACSTHPSQARAVSRVGAEIWVGYTCGNPARGWIHPNQWVLGRIPARAALGCLLWRGEHGCALQCLPGGAAGSETEPRRLTHAWCCYLPCVVSTEKRCACGLIFFKYIIRGK